MSFTEFVAGTASHLRGMDIPSWYSFVMACVSLVWLLFRGLLRAITSEWPSTSLFVLKHLKYPHIFPRVQLLGAATRWDTLLTLLYLGTNVLLITIGGASLSTMSVANLIPLLCGPRLSLITKLLGISTRTSIGGHQWFGRTAIAQALIHMIFSLDQSHTFLWTPATVSGVVVFTLTRII